MLLGVLCDYSSLNTISDSNHTCLVKLRDDAFLTKAPRLGSVESINNPRVPTLHGRKRKLHTKIFTNSDGLSNLRYFDNVPVELVPEVLKLCKDFDIGKEACRSKVGHSLVFGLLRAMPCIFVVRNHLNVVISRKRKYNYL